MSVFPVRSLVSDPFFSEGFGFGLGPGPSATGFFMDWKETPEALLFKFDLPGLTKEDVKLQVHDVRKEEDDDNYCEKRDLKWHCKENDNDGSFCREFRLPENALVDQIRASMSEGVLVVTVPKDRSKKKKKKHVKKHAVEIAGEADHGGSAKRLGRFVCCNT